MARVKAQLIKCVKCGKQFVPKRSSQKYCSEGCRVSYYDEHYFRKAEATKICPNCGTSFVTSAPKKRVYCSPECREEAQKKRIEAETSTYLGERYAAFERDEFRCTVCGRGIQDGARLDVCQDGATLKTVCLDCKAGKMAGDDGTRHNNH